jgi:vancomycin aglycone glucosyltransferase
MISGGYAWSGGAAVVSCVRIVLAPVGTRGDVQPMIALARELIARGHDVVFCVAENFAPVAHAIGATYARGGEDVQALVQREGDRMKSIAGFVRLAKTTILEQFDLLEAAAQGADVIVGTPLLAAGRTIAERLGVPVLCAAYFPNIFPCVDLPPPMFPRAPRALNGVAWSAYRAIVAVGIEPIVRAARKQRGMDRGITLFESLHHVPILCAFDDALGSAPNGWVAQHELTGFWFYDDPDPLPDDVVRFLDAGDAPVFLGFGSMPHDDGDQRARAITSAVEALGVRAIVSAGWANLSGVDHARVLSVGALNHRALFPRCAAVVHHGGAGTTSQAARAGVPQVVVPHLFDQFYWASRTHALGVAPRPLSVHFSATDLTRAIEEARAPPMRDAARALAARMPNDGVGRAAERILAAVS